MKILVLMPLDEKWTYMATGLYNALPHEIKEKTFAMPMFMQYAVTTKAAPNWLYATFDALVAAKSVYAAAKEDDLILIGNCSKDLTFDAIFNFQDLEQDMSFEDLLMTKTQELVKDTPELNKYVNNLYQAEDSRMPLHNLHASADFLTAYLDTDPKLDEIRKQYEGKLDLKEYERRNKKDDA